MDARRHVAWGRDVLDTLCEDPPEAERRRARRKSLEAELRASGGVTGELAPDDRSAPPRPPHEDRDGMKRFISHEELARDSRFKRAGARGRLLESLPDEVDGVVALMEHVAPTLHARVKGTELEKVYDELGPGYPFLTQFGSLHPEDPNVEVQLKVRLHGIFVGELQALEGAGRTLWDFPDAPWEFRMNMARQCWDESRHCQVFEKLLDHVGVDVGDYPETTTLFEAACADDPTLRVAGVNRCLEGLACDAFRAMIDYAKEAAGSGHGAGHRLRPPADELTHVRFGSNWVKQFTRSNPEKFREAKEFQRDVERRFSIGTGRSGRDDAAIGFAREERLEAGFTEEELRELAELADQGPSRDTLVEAAKVLRERHLARSRGEAVEPIHWRPEGAAAAG